LTPLGFASLRAPRYRAPLAKTFRAVPPGSARSALRGRCRV